MSEGIYRYPSNIAAMPTGARIAGERMERAMKRAGKTGEAFDLLTRIERAHRGENWQLLDALMIEAKELIAETGGAA
jgi:hypothetical protein